MIDQMPPTNNCAAFDAVLHRVLDGESPVTALHDAHTDDCRDCRELAAATRLLLEGLTTSLSDAPPPDFANRIVPQVLAERKRETERRWTARVVAFTLAASVMMAFFAANPWRADRPDARPAHQNLAAVPKTPPSVAKSFADAGTAFVSLTKRAADESFSPAKNLFANLDLTKPAPAVTPSREAANPSSSAVQPITNTAKRAFNLFIRDVGGLATIPAMKS